MGNVSVLKIEKELNHIVPTNYAIPFSTSHGETHTFMSNYMYAEF